MVPWSKKENILFNVTFPCVIKVSCILPLAGLFLCELLCLLIDFKESTSTVCTSGYKAWNFLPSVSQATGYLSPQTYIWKVAIALHATPRFVIAAGYRNLNFLVFSDGSPSSKTYKRLSSGAFFLHCIEILSLVGLSFVSSKENFDVHKVCFVTFLLSSTLHMFVLSAVQCCGTQAIKYWQSWREKLSVWLKIRLFVLHLACLVMAMYFYYRHNKYCEDGVYSMFALCEILLISANIAFHGTAMLDFHCTNLMLQDFPERC